MQQPAKYEHRAANDERARPYRHHPGEPDAPISLMREDRDQHDGDAKGEKDSADAH